MIENWKRHHKPQSLEVHYITEVEFLLGQKYELYHDSRLCFDGPTRFEGTEKWYSTTRGEFRSTETQSIHWTSQAHRSNVTEYCFVPPNKSPLEKTYKTLLLLPYTVYEILQSQSLINQSYLIISHIILWSFTLTPYTGRGSGTGRNLHDYELYHSIKEETGDVEERESTREKSTG